MKVLEEDPANTNNVILIYSRRSEPKTTFGTTEGWNREHLWADSYGIDSQEPAYSDLHNLRAADATVNSTRGNKFFDISDTKSPGYKCPASPEAPCRPLPEKQPSILSLGLSVRHIRCRIAIVFVIVQTITTPPDG